MKYQYAQVSVSSHCSHVVYLYTVITATRYKYQVDQENGFRDTRFYDRGGLDCFVHAMDRMSTLFMGGEQSRFLNSKYAGQCSSVYNPATGKLQHTALSGKHRVEMLGTTKKFSSLKRNVSILWCSP